ncbi:MAG: His-Xaa-Ser system protein HxsD [Rhabdochlamydiaceae bacterium]
MNSPPDNVPWIRELDDGTLTISVYTSLYSLQALFRTCYLFTDRCYLFLEPEESDAQVRVSIAAKSQGGKLKDVAGEFCNELINQKLRSDIAAETRPIRELIVAQAFAEADFRDQSQSEGDYSQDPRGIAK